MARNMINQMNWNVRWFMVTAFYVHEAVTRNARLNRVLYYGNMHEFIGNELWARLEYFRDRWMKYIYFVNQFTTTDYKLVPDGTFIFNDYDENSYSTNVLQFLNGINFPDDTRRFMPDYNIYIKIDLTLPPDLLEFELKRYIDEYREQKGIEVDYINQKNAREHPEDKALYLDELREFRKANHNIEIMVERRLPDDPPNNEANRICTKLERHIKKAEETISMVEKTMLKDCELITEQMLEEHTKEEHILRTEEPETVYFWQRLMA
jgi:hypothetical protein